MNDSTPKVQATEANSDMGSEGRADRDMHTRSTDPLLPRLTDCPTCAVQYSVSASNPDPLPANADS